MCSLNTVTAIFGLDNKDDWHLLCTLLLANKRRSKALNYRTGFGRINTTLQ